MIHMWNKVSKIVSWDLPFGVLCCMSSQSFPCFAIPIMMTTTKNVHVLVSFSLLSTVTEDLPQIVLAINVAHHMTHLISVIQILKAMYGVIEPIVRITKISNDMDEKNMTNKHASTKCQKLFDGAFTFILCLSSCVLCILVFNLK